MYKNLNTTTLRNKGAELVFGLGILAAMSGISVVLRLDPSFGSLSNQLILGIVGAIGVGSAIAYTKVRNASVYAVASDTIEKSAKATPTVSTRSLSPSIQTFVESIVSCDCVSRVTCHSLNDNSIGIRVVLTSPIVSSKLRSVLRSQSNTEFFRPHGSENGDYAIWVRVY